MRSRENAEHTNSRGRSNTCSFLRRLGRSWRRASTASRPKTNDCCRWRPSSEAAGIAEEAEDSIRQSLTRLQAAEFLYEVRLFPELEYTFKHALTHEVTYGGLLND